MEDFSGQVISQISACLYLPQVMEDDNRTAVDDPPMKTCEANDPESGSGAQHQATLKLAPKELSLRNAVGPCGNRPGDARPATGLKNGERATTEQERKYCRVQPSAEEMGLTKGVEPDPLATERSEENLAPCVDIRGEGNGRKSLRSDIYTPSPYSGTESSRLKGAVEKEGARCSSTGSEAAQRNNNAQVVGEEPNGLDVAETGGTSRGLASGEVLERSGASAVWMDGRDQAKHLGEEAHCSPKAAVAQAGEPVLAKEMSSPPSPSQPRPPSASPEARRVESSKAVAAPSDSARTSEDEGAARAVISENGSVTSAPIGAVARTPSRGVSTYGSMIAPGSDSQDGTACRSLPRGSVWGSTEHLAMSGHKGARVEHENMEPNPWGEPTEHESFGDTTDVALAAISYANSIAEGEVGGSLTSGAAAGVAGTGTRQRTPPSPNLTCEQSSVLIPGASEEREGDEIASAAATPASAITQPASRTSSNGRVPPNDSKVSKATPPTSDTSRALSSNGVRRTTRGEKGSRASDHHEDMMHAMCMICLEKLSETSKGGRSKLLGILDSCSHRYCYTVSRFALVAEGTM